MTSLNASSYCPGVGICHVSNLRHPLAFLHPSWDRSSLQYNLLLWRITRELVNCKNPQFNCSPIYKMNKWWLLVVLGVVTRVQYEQCLLANDMCPYRIWVESQKLGISISMSIPHVIFYLPVRLLFFLYIILRCLSALCQLPHGFAYWNCGYFSRGNFANLSRGGYFHDITHISLIKPHGLYFRGEFRE